MSTSSENVTHMTASRALLQQYIDSNRAPHLIPLAQAIRDHGCAVAIVLPQAGRFRLPNDRPCVLFVGDDHETCEGPAAFHLPSLRRFVRTCRVAAIIACAPPESLYRLVINDATVLRRNVTIVETRGTHEADWYATIAKIKPHLSLALGLVQGEGTA